LTVLIAVGSYGPDIKIHWCAQHHLTSVFHPLLVPTPTSLNLNPALPSFAQRNHAQPNLQQPPIDKMSRNPAPSGSRKISFNVSEQYEIQDVVGEGAYGVVW